MPRRWAPPPSPVPRRPYRDSVLLYLVLAVVIVMVAWATGGSLLRAVGFAAVFFLLATGWSWWRWSQRLARERAAAKPSRR
jgi:nicotinamide riboside transporter PnuC